MNNIKAIIFDFDGTIVDSHSVWVKYINPEIFRRRGLPEDTKLNIEELTGMNFFDMSQYYIDKYGLDTNIEDISRERIEIATYFYNKVCSLKPGAKEVIKYSYNNGIKIAIASSNIGEIVTAYLTKHGLLKYINTIVTSDMVKRPKPFPDVFLKAAVELGVHPENILVFEDSLEGVLAANAAEMQVFSVFEKYNDYCIDKIKQNSSRYILDLNEAIDFIEENRGVKRNIRGII